MMARVSACCALVCALVLSAQATKIDLPQGVTEEAYCVACETMAEQVFRRLSDPDLRDRKDRIDEILRNLCSQGYFHNVVEYPPRDMVKACKHIFKGYKKQVATSIESVLSSTGTLAELRTAMCHTTAPACRNVRQPVYAERQGVNTVTDDATLDAIEAYIAAHNGEIKSPRPMRRDEL